MSAQSKNVCVDDVSFRNRSIKQAISWSLVCKVSSLLLQFLSYPLAARVLEKFEFGIFTTISMAVMAIVFLELGIGPALGKKLSEANATKQRDLERTLYLNGIVLISLLAIVAICALGILISIFPITTIFGKHYSGWESQMTTALWLGAIMSAILFILSHIDQTRDGYMEASIRHAWGALGNFGCAIAIIVVIYTVPTINNLLLALFVPQIVVRAINMLLLWKKRPYLNPFLHRPKFSRSATKALLGDGISFTASFTLAFLVEYNICSLIIGRIYGPSEVAVHQAIVTIMMAFSGLIIMIGTPLWAAFVDAKERGDRQWMHTSTKRFYLFWGFLSICALIGLLTLGPWILTKWYGPEFVVSRITFLALSAVLITAGWRQIHHLLSLGLDVLKKTVKPMMASVALGLLFGVPLLNSYGLAGLFAGQAIGICLATAYSLPAMIWRGINSSTSKGAA